MVVAEYPTKYMDAILYRNVKYGEPDYTNMRMWKKYSIKSTIVGYTEKTRSDVTESYWRTSGDEKDYNCWFWAATSYTSNNGKYTLVDPGFMNHTSMGSSGYLYTCSISRVWNSTPGYQDKLMATSPGTNLYIFKLMQTNSMFDGRDIIFAHKKLVANYSKTKGTFIENVYDLAGTYPNDGISGSYWYTIVA